MRKILLIYLKSTESRNFAQKICFRIKAKKSTNSGPILEFSAEDPPSHDCASPGLVLRSGVPRTWIRGETGNRAKVAHKIFGFLLTSGISIFFLELIFFFRPVYAADLPQPTSMPILTIAGAIEQTNRGPIDKFADAYFEANGIEFDKAAAFDLGMLNQFRKHSFKVDFPNWAAKEPQKVSGILLKDVLETVGAKGTMLNVTALDSYSAKINLTDLDKYPVILATHLNSKPLGIGGRGPLWVVYPWNDYPELRNNPKHEALWVWSAYFMRIE